MGTRVTTPGISFLLVAAFVGLVIVPSLASARESGRNPLAFSIIDQVTKRLCDRQEALGARLGWALIHPSKCQQDPPPDEDVSVDISAEPMTITEGESAELSWESENADSCEASDGWSGDKDTSGSETVSPTETTTYTITCEGDGESDSDSVTVTVNEDEPDDVTVDITANPSTITEGGSSELTWNSENADTCTASNGWTGDKAVDGMQTVSPTTTTTYAIECEGDGGTASDSVTVTVNAAEPETGTLIVRKVVIRDDGDTTATTSFSFEVNDDAAVAFEADGENGMTVDVGTYDIVETAVEGFTTTYNNCTDVAVAEGETEICTITNNDVEDAEEPTVSITASRTNVFEGSANEATTTLSWDSTNADSCVASNGWSGDKGVDGSETVTPTATTTYAIECTGDGGTAQDSVTVNFVPEADEPTPSNNLLITEVHYDLATSSEGTEPANEWVELHNGTDQTLDLEGYTISDAAGSDTIPAGISLEPGEFLIITSSSTTAGFYDIPSGTQILVLASSIGSNGLANAGDMILIENDEGNSVDEVSWGTNTSAFSPSIRPSPTADDFPGQSIGRIDINVDTGSALDWETKTDPTPGEE